MKILITGATGLIGQELTNLLLQNKHTVHYLTTSPIKNNSRDNYFGFHWDIKNNQIDANCLEGVDVIVHLAGASIAKKWTKSYKVELLESRTHSADLLFELLKSQPNQVKHFISASGTAIYPDNNTEIYDETSQVKDASFLGNLVVKWENSADQFKSLNLNVTKVRTGIVFSNKGGALLEMVRPIKMFVGSGFGSGIQLQSWIHLKDVGNLYYFIIKNQTEGIINAVSPNSISNQELTKAIATQLHRPLFLPNIPRWFMKLILGEMHILLFNNKNIIPKRAVDLGFQFQFPTAKKALEDLY